MLQKTEKIWWNGRLIPWDEAKTHVLTHTLHYGGGAFEGIRCYKTEKGPAIFKLKQHIDRLFYSIDALKMPMSFTNEQVRNAIIEVVRVNKMEEGYIRPIAFYGYGKMGVNPEGAPSELTIACWPWGAYLPHESIAVKISRYIRVHPDSTIVDAKLCGHYLNSIMASLEIRGTHYHEALLLDSKGYISEGVGENFFIIKDNVIYTPQLGTILAGITRDTVMELAHRLGYKVIESNITPAQAYQADETFFTGTAAEVTPIHSIDDHVIGNGSVGPISAKIKAAYNEVVRGKNPDFIKDLTFV